MLRHVCLLVFFFLISNSAFAQCGVPDVTGYIATTYYTVWPDHDQDYSSPKDAAPVQRCYNVITTVAFGQAWEEGYTTTAPAQQSSYDCDDNARGALAFPHFLDNDGDGDGSGPSLGMTCDTSTVKNNYDCDDNNPKIFQSFQYGFPDHIACNKYKAGIKGENASSLDPGVLKIDVFSDDLDQDRNYILAGFLIRGDLNYTEKTFSAGCIENCPRWTLARAGGIVWQHVSFEGMKPNEPYKNGVFDPKEPAEFDVKVFVVSSYSDGYSSTEILKIKYIPDCPELKTQEGRDKIFNSGFMLNEQPKEFESKIEFRFKPICPSTKDKDPVELKKLAKAMGFDHFNWVQTYTHPGAKHYIVSVDTFQKYIQLGLPVPKREYQDEAPWVLDPRLDSNITLVTIPDPQGPDMIAYGIAIANPDPFVFYLNEGQELQSYTSKTELGFDDAPTAPAGWYAENGIGYYQPRMLFQTRVAGVTAEGTYAIASPANLWSSKKEGCYDGGCGATYGLSFGAKHLHASADYARLVGSNSLTGISGLDLHLTPSLIGKDPSTAEFQQEFTNGGYLNVVTVSHQESENVEEGRIISQSPFFGTLIPSRSTIQVVLSSGKAKPCGTIPSGAQTTRTLYQKSSVPFGTSCDSVKETQVGTCSQGTITYEGTAKFDSCVIEPKKEALCTKTVKKICKAGFFQTVGCTLPANVLSIKRDASYKGSKCHEAPKTLTYWNALQFINSFINTNTKLEALLGCDAQFEITYSDKCNK